MNTKTTTVSKKAGLIKIRIEMHRSSYRAGAHRSIRADREPAQQFKPVVAFLWLAKQPGMAEEVVVRHEAGCNPRGRRFFDGRNGLAGDSLSAALFVGCAAGGRCSRIAKPALPPARKPSSPSPVNSPSTSGESPPDECRLKNLAWCKKVPLN